MPLLHSTVFPKIGFKHLNIRETLVFQGKAPVDRRGKHRNRKHAISEETITKVCEFIASLKGRKSHYSLKKSKKLYLPEELNITKLFNMYTAKNPDNPVSYAKFRDRTLAVFVTRSKLKSIFLNKNRKSSLKEKKKQKSFKTLKIK